MAASLIDSSATAIQAILAIPAIPATSNPNILFTHASRMVVFFSQVFGEINIPEFQSASAMFKLNAAYAETHGNNRYNTFITHHFKDNASQFAEKMEIPTYFDNCIDMAHAFANGADTSKIAGLTNGAYEFVMQVVDLLDIEIKKPNVNQNTIHVLKAVSNIIQFNTGTSNKVAHVHGNVPDVVFDEDLLMQFITGPFDANFPTDTKTLINQMVTFAVEKFTQMIAS